MAAKTPDNIYTESLGNLKLIRAVFSSTNIDDGDTWDSNIVGIVPNGFWFGATNNPGTQASAGVHVAESSDTFTFYPGEDNATGTLFILVRG